MNTPEKPKAQDTETLKQIPHWTHAYARNRTIPVLISLSINLCLIAGIAIPSYIGSRAFVDGNTVLVCLYSILLVASMTCLIIVSVPPWGTRMIKRISHLGGDYVNGV